MAKLRIEGEAFSTVTSNCGSPISSWMSDLSMGSEAEQSLHSFSQSQSQQGEALAEPEPSQNLLFVSDGLGGYENGGSPKRGTLEGELVMSENGSNKATATKDRLRKLPPSMAKTNIQILAGPSNFSPFKTTISVHPCVAVKPMVIQEQTILSSPTKTSSTKDPSKYNAPLLASISSEMSFEDPWLKRVVEEGRCRERVCEVRPEKRDVEYSKSQAIAATGDHHSFYRDGKRGWTGIINQTAIGNRPSILELLFNQCSLSFVIFPSPGGDHGSSSSGGEIVSSPDSFTRLVDGCEMVAVVAQGECSTSIYSSDIHRTASLPRGWHRLNRHDGLDNGNEYRSLGVTTSTPCSPRATLDRRGSAGKPCFISHKKGGIPPLPPIRKSSLDQRNRAASLLQQPCHGASLLGIAADDAQIARQRGASIDSSRLFSAKLEQLANRTNSLGRVHGTQSGSQHYDCFSLERGGSVRGGEVKGDSTMPRTGRSSTRAGSGSSPFGNISGFSGGPGPSSAPQSPAKTSGQSKISAVSKLLMTSSPKARSLSSSSTKTLSFSTKSLSQASSRSSSLPPNGKVRRTF